MNPKSEDSMPGPSQQRAPAIGILGRAVIVGGIMGAANCHLMAYSAHWEAMGEHNAAKVLMFPGTWLINPPALIAVAYAIGYGCVDDTWRHTLPDIESCLTGSRGVHAQAVALVLVLPGLAGLFWTVMAVLIQRRFARSR
jgi:hypothetical protein